VFDPEVAGATAMEGGSGRSQAAKATAAATSGMASSQRQRLCGCDPA
jgi:hypothetical protein